MVQLWLGYTLGHSGEFRSRDRPPHRCFGPVPPVSSLPRRGLGECFEDDGSKSLQRSLPVPAGIGRGPSPAD